MKMVWSSSPRTGCGISTDSSWVLTGKTLWPPNNSSRFLDNTAQFDGSTVPPHPGNVYAGLELHPVCVCVCHLESSGKSPCLSRSVFVLDLCISLYLVLAVSENICMYLCVSVFYLHVCVCAYFTYMYVHVCSSVVLHYNLKMNSLKA